MADILTETYQRIRLRLKARAGKVLADAEAAEDALQDAFVKLWGRYPVRNETEDRETRFRRVEEMVDTVLTDIQRKIIQRHEYEGVTLERIAEELGIQPPAVRMQLSRARKTIREQYRKRYHEE